MERLKEFHGRRVYLDTNVFVYATELRAEDAESEELRQAIELAADLIRLINHQAIDAVTSFLTRAELLVKPLRDGK